MNTHFGVFERSSTDLDKVDGCGSYCLDLASESLYSLCSVVLIVCRVQLDSDTELRSCSLSDSIDDLCDNQSPLLRCATIRIGAFIDLFAVRLAGIQS
jgi:hypothetical protein